MWRELDIESRAIDEEIKRLYAKLQDVRKKMQMIDFAENDKTQKKMFDK